MDNDPDRTQSPTVSPAPSPAPLDNDDDDDRYGARTFAYIVLAFVLLFATCIGCLCIKSYRRRREQRLMDQRSAQADSVLGDMQMISQDDPDDNELI